MRKLTLLAILLTASVAGAETTAFVNVHVVPMDSERVIRNQTVLVENHQITAIGNFGDMAVPDEAVLIDGTDRFLMPGLAEMHGHVPTVISDNLERVLGLYVANGVTLVRGMLGQRSHLTLRQRIASGQTLGPRLVTSGPSLNGNSVSSPEEGARMVREQKAAGYDFLKIHPGLTREEFDAIAASANEVGIPFAGHVPEDVGVPRALAAGMASIDHLDGYMQSLQIPNEDSSGGVSGFFGVFIADQADERLIDQLARQTADAGTWNVPTEALFVHVTSPELLPQDLAARTEMQYMPRDTVENWERAKERLFADASYDSATAARAIELRRRLLLSLQQNGAGILLGSDAPQVFNVPGFSIHHELGYLVAAGLTPYQALQAGTTSPAAFFAETDRYGKVLEGYAADLILLDANPLDDINATRRIHGVMVNGRWLSRGYLDDLLASFEQ